MPATLSDRQRLELAIPAYLLYALGSLPGVFVSADPEDSGSADADLTVLRAELRTACLEPFADLVPRKRDALGRRLDRITRGEISQWRGQPALSVMLALWCFLDDLIQRDVLILWEGSAMDRALLQLRPMCEHGFAQPMRVAAAREQGARLLAGLQVEGLYH